MRLSVAAGFAAASLAAPVAGAQHRDDPRAIQPYASTLTYGTGLITIPVAWISPGTGDFFVSVSTRAIYEGEQIIPKSSGSRWDFNEAAEAHFGGRVSVGASLYDPRTMQVGAFGQLLLVRQADGGPRWLPSIALGARNVGSSKYQDRFVTGSRRVVDAAGGRTGDVGTFNGSPSIYAVGTREFTWARASGSFSIGYGSGLFRNDGEMGSTYNENGTILPGLFFGGRIVKPLGDVTRLTLLLDNDGFDFNVGAQLGVGGLTVGLMLTEVEEQGSATNRSELANFNKAGALISYNASLPGMVRGNRQRAEAASAKLMVKRLNQEVKQRRVLAARLAADLARAAQAADAATVAERRRLQLQLEAEQAALKAAAERLEALTRKPPEGR